MNKEDELGNHHLPTLLHQSTWDDRRLHDALAVLCELSFIYYDNTKQMCWTHPMVRLWARNRLQPEERKYWLEAATNLLAKVNLLSTEYSLP